MSAALTLEVKDLHYAYPPMVHGATSAPVLRGVSFQLARGEFAVLLGRVGAGKTTLCMALNGLAPHATGGVHRGEVLVGGRDTKQHAVAELARSAGIVFQDAEAQLTQMQVADEVAFGLENLGLPPAEIDVRIAWALDVVGLSACRDRSPLRLSGGEKQRVAIASVLAMHPELLVLDEPTANLDPAGKTAVFRVAARLAREQGVAILMATQDVEHAARHAGRVLVLHRGRIALDGSPEDVFGRATLLRRWGIGMPEAAELAHLLAESTGRRLRPATVGAIYDRLRRDLPPAVRAPAASAEPSGNAASRELRSPAQDGVDLTHGAQDSAGRPAAGLRTTPLVAMEGVSFDYPDGAPGLRDVSFAASSGELVALLGPNGSGKTTLAKHLNGLLRPTSGRVLIAGQDARALRVAQLARQVGYVFQNPDHQLFAATVEEEVAFGVRLQGRPPDETAARVAAAIERFGLQALAHLPPAVLSAGRRRQVALASVMATDPALLILDEPTGELDWRSRCELMAAVAAYRASGRAVLLITHDMRLAAEHATRAVVLLCGSVLFDGAPGALFARRDLLRQAGLAAPPAARLAARLARRGFPDCPLTVAGIAEAWAGGKGTSGKRPTGSPPGMALPGD